MTNNIAIKDDALRRAIKAAIPEPDAEYEARIESCLRSLPADVGSRTARLSYFRSRPLLAAALILLLLALTAGAAYAAGSLFRNVFGKAKDSVNEGYDQYHEDYQQAHEQMEHMTTEEAAIIDTELDYRVETLISELFLTDVWEKGCVKIGGHLGELLISEMAVYDHFGTDRHYSRHLYFGTAAQEGTEIPFELAVNIDGIRCRAEDMLMDIPSEGSESYAVYDCAVICDASELAETSIICLQYGEDRLCFKYVWKDAKVIMPKNDAELNSWLESLDAMTERADSVTCTCSTPAKTEYGVTVYVVSAAIEDGKLILKIRLEATEEAIGKRLYFGAVELDGGKQGPLRYRITGPSRIEWREEKLEGTVIYEIEPPFDPANVSGSTLPFNTSFTLVNANLTEQWEILYDFELSFD